MTAPGTTTGLLVVGGGPAAHHAAAACREHGGPVAVLLISDDDTPPYVRPPLSKELLRGGTTEDELSLGELDGVEVRTGCAVTELSTRERRARLDDGGTVAFETCVLATGSAPVPLPVPGGPEARHLRRLSDARALLGDLRHARSVAIVGAGFIGCEAAAALAAPGARGDRVQRRARAPGHTPGRRRRRPAGRLAARRRCPVPRRCRGDRHRDHHDPAGGPCPRRRPGVRRPGPGGRRCGAAQRPGRTGRARGRAGPRRRRRAHAQLRTGNPRRGRPGPRPQHRRRAPARREHWSDAEAMGRIAGTTAAGGGFSAWFQLDGALCGIATHLADDDYARGVELVRRASPASAAPGTTDAGA